MARQTRQQRRARRTEVAEQSQRGAPPPPRRPTRDGAQPAEPARPRPEAHAARAVPGSGLLRFVRESWGELGKVEWPGQKQVLAGTAVVLIACAIVGTYLWVNDLVWQRFVQNVLLK